MIRLKIKIKAESTSFIKTVFLDDNFNISKQNRELQAIVEKAVKESAMEVVEDVLITANFEW